MKKIYIYKNKITKEYYNFFDSLNGLGDVTNIDNASQYELEYRDHSMNDPFYERVEHSKEVRRLKLLKIKYEE